MIDAMVSSSTNGFNADDLLDAACERWPITLRQGARVIEDSRRLRTV
jgi:hypothetical protein